MLARSPRIPAGLERRGPCAPREDRLKAAYPRSTAMPDRPRTDPPKTIDLHGLGADAAVRAVEREVHSAHVQGLTELRIVTGRGLGNRLQVPVLRPAVEGWLRTMGPHRGVLDFHREPHGGALRVRLRRR